MTARATESTESAPTRLLNTRMRWSEIIEASSPTEKAAKEAERARKAREKVSDAQRKRSDAARRYQAQMRTAGDSPSKRGAAGQHYQSALQRANDQQRDAQAKLRESDVRE
jgi:hypothetical protein